MTEQSVSDPGAASSAPATHPLGNPEGPGEPGKVPTVSIVDNILDLDALMSADVRRAEKTARFFLEAWREGRIDELDAELQLLTDSPGAPLPTVDPSVGGTDADEAVRTAYMVALELQEEQAAMGRSAQAVRMRQVSDDDWDEFQVKWKTALGEGPPYPREFWNELIAMSAHQPKIPIESVRKMRKKLGAPPMDVLGQVAWDVNANSGVSIPKSRLSSLVLKRGARTQS